jgi:prevent-host-death family protein
MDADKWTVAEAKAKFCAVIDLAQSQGPQTITRNGRDTVVIVAVSESCRVLRCVALARLQA